MTTERVTVTLPQELIAEMDRLEKNRSRFVAEAVAHELARRRRAAMLQSLATPHPEAREVEQLGFASWGASFVAEDAGLLDPTAGTPVRWIEGRGFVEDRG